MPSTSWGYRAAIHLGTVLAPALGLLDPKIRAGDSGRREAGDRLLEWARWNRDTGRPLAWFHAASVGEGLQAESVLRQLQQLRPDCQIIYTHFSPSAEEFARHLSVDAADYLPYDRPDAATRLLDSLEPDLLVFAKLDLWPELATRAATSGCHVVIVAAAVTPTSARLRWPARRLLEPGYRVVTSAGAISPEDAGRLAQLGVPQGRIRVLGDPRFDSVIGRVNAVDPADPLLRFGRGAPTMVAGSTWPADESVLLSAFARLRLRRPDARLILVPHEPTAAHLGALEKRAGHYGLPAPVRLSGANGPVPLLVVDRVGILSTLYGCGTMAYVGGGFGAAGLHSVLEPAAWGVPVVFGPRWRNSRDAGLLLEAGAARALPRAVGGRAARALERQWERWIVAGGERESQGSRARAVVERGVGASARSAEMLASLISTRPLRRSPTAARAVPPSEQ
ncbi:MAG: 3-deoxy-D-manno-octulosonic acid transferase [Gemmatimonadales bacterium]